MPRKILLVSVGAALLLAGCATPRSKPAPPSPAPPSPVATSVLPSTVARDAAPPKPRTLLRAAPKETPQTAVASTRAQLPALIGDGATWTAPGYQSLAVKRGASPQQPVPIFRQAGALATVRAALAESPTQPQAEFRNGVLTLKFDRGSNEDIAAAVNKALSVTGSRNLQVALQP